MKCALLCLLAMAAWQQGAQASSTNPIKKVLQMISDLQARIIAMGEEEQKLYNEKTELCEDRARKLSFEIKTGKAEVADLQANIDQQTAAVTKCNAKIEELSSDISTDEADLKKATAIREQEAADFVAVEKESKVMIDSLDRSIGVLTREMQKSGASMLQMQSAKGVTDALTVLVQASTISSDDASRLTAMLQENTQMQEQREYDADGYDDALLGAPAAGTYEGHSDGIVSVLEGLMEKAEGQLESARKAEANSLHNFEVLKQSLTNQIKFANKDLDEVKKQLAEGQEKKSVAKGDLDVTSKDLAGDIKTKEALHHECMSAAQEFELATASRNAELKAVTQAKSIIADNTGGAESQTYGLNQVSFLQVAGQAASVDFKTVRYVRDLAKKQQSPMLAQLASRIASVVRLGATSGQDPYVKVKGLISGMIAKLEGEASEDASQKAYCDKEMSETAEKKEEKATELNSLSTKLDQKKSAASKFRQQVSTLQEELGAMTKAFGQATELRLKEKATYKKDKVELDQGLKGVQVASAMLREYYATDKETDHQSEGGMGGSVIAMLEVIESDMTKGLAELVSEEETAAREYEEYSNSYQVEKVAKEKDVQYKTKEYKSLDKVISEISGDLSGVQDENAAVLEYDAKIQKACVAKAEPYEEKKKRREQEMEGLKDALTALEQQTSLLQKTSKITLRGSRAH